MSSYDVIVIGSGPGGYVTAIRAAQLGFKTAIVERDALGGVCLNWGCIPTKALLRSAEVFDLITHAREFGISIDGARFDLAAMVKRSRDVAKRLSSGVAYLMKKHKITVVTGAARLEKGAKAPGVIVEGPDGKTTRLTGDHVILATGARARTLPQAGLAPDGDRIWTYREAMVPQTLPKSLLVVGSGAIGIEFASFYRTLGVDVCVVEMMDRILPVEDDEISAMARKAFEKQGMKIHTGATLESIAKHDAGVSASVRAANGETLAISAERVIVAIGIVGAVEGLGLEALGVRIDRTHVVVDGVGRTGVPGLYAIGDLTGPPWLAHKASHEGVICIEAIAGGSPAHALQTDRIPGCTYSRPQIASIGMTERAAKAAGRETRIGRFPFVGNGKAIALGEPDGLVKTIFDARTGELLGAHMIGAEVTELIQGYAVAMTGELTQAELIETVFPHPTLSEMMHEAVLDAYGRVVHI